MKIVIFLAITIFAMLYVGGFKLTFSPFHIEIPFWKSVIGFIFLSISISFFGIDSTEQGRRQAYKEIRDKIEEIVKEKEELK